MASYYEGLVNNREAAKKAAAEEEKAEHKRTIAAKNFNTSLNMFVDEYRKWAKDNKSDKFKDASDDDIKNRMVDLINKSGVADGKIDEGDDSSKDYYDYGVDFIDNMFSKKGSFFKGDEGKAKLRAAINDDDKSALRELAKLEGNISGYRKGQFATREEALAGIDQDKARRGLEVRKRLDEAAANINKKSNKNDFMDIFENYESYQTKEETPEKSESSNKSAATASNASEDDSDTVEFTLTRANDPNYRGFGQKLVDLGLATDNGLWGENGDVAYYTKQLNDQGIYGNLPIGKTIRLKRRK